MSGTLFGLGMSQRVDANGKPLVGWLLYIYLQNSSTPVNTFLDTALTVQQTWPLIADSSGMSPPFWVPDGSYRARGTDAAGATILYDIPSIQSIGPSAGPAPSGSVDPNAIYQTGDTMWQDVQTTRPGWVRDNGRTIGSATSGAAERQNADCQNLFTFLWNTFTQVQCPVVGGRGGSANLDWTASKQITMPDKRGYVPGGLDDMGNTPAGRYAGVPIIAGTVTTPGALLGEQSHALVLAEAPAHIHNALVTDPGHIHDVISYTGAGSAQVANGPNFNAVTGPQNNQPTTSSPTGVTVTNDSQGGGGAHNNVQQTVLGTFFRKL